MNRREAMLAMGAALLPVDGPARQPLPQPSPSWASWDEVCQQLVELEQEANRQNHPGDALHYTHSIRWSDEVCIGYGVGSQLEATTDSVLLIDWTDRAGLVMLGSWGADDNEAWAVAIHTPTKADELAVKKERGAA